MRYRLISLLTACLLGQAVLLLADFQVPPLSGAVVDSGGMMSSEGAAKIDAMLRELWQKGGSQYAVLTVPDLGGDVIEQASIKVTDIWKLGDKKKDNGVLIMLSKSERKIRIEVGQGLEGDLTDAFCGRVIRESMVPLLKLGKTDEAVEAALGRLIPKSDPNFAPAAGLAKPRRHAGIPFGLIFIILIVLIHVITRIFGSASGRNRRGGGGYWGGGFGGGGSGGGSFGGGGFSGGGGGFSGGGSSGSW